MLTIILPLRRQGSVQRLTRLLYPPYTPVQVADLFFLSPFYPENSKSADTLLSHVELAKCLVAEILASENAVTYLTLRLATLSHISP